MAEWALMHRGEMQAGNGVPAGPSAPVAWQTLRWIIRPGAFMRECRDRYGDVFSITLVEEGTWVMCADPEGVKQVFTGSPDVLHAGEANDILRPLVGSNSVLLLDGAAHMGQRKLMLPPFHGERMQRYAEVMAEAAEEQLARWPLGERAPALPRMQALTLEVIMRAVFGIDEAARLDRTRAALRELMGWIAGRWRLVVGIALGLDRVESSAVLGFRQAKQRADAVLFEEIARRRDDPDAAQREDILSMLLQARHEDGSAMSDEELRDELMTLLVAGHETTASALAWTLELLSRHPDVLARLEQELDDGSDDYLEAVIYESLRLRPILPIVLRHTKEPFELLGRELPAGVKVAPCIFLVHRNPDIYPDPDSFRPERFLDEGPGTYTWFPFGGGIRRCIGASFALFEMNVVLKTMLRDARLRPAPDARPERIRRRAITFAPERGATVVLERRSPVREPVAV
jgi:cytochrome P450